MQSTFYNSDFKKPQVTAILSKARPYTKKLLNIVSTRDYGAHESSLAIAGDSKYQSAIARKLKNFTDIKHVVLVGIGGSSLGTEAVYHALKTGKSPSLMVLDSLEPEAYDELKTLIRKVKNQKHIALIIVSKSGTTSETIFNAGVALELFKSAYGKDYSKSVITISDDGTKLHTLAKKNKILHFTIPKTIGGRFSVFTAVGIVPLTLLKIDIIELRKGAAHAVSPEILKTHLASPTLLALHAQKGIHTVNFFTFNKSLTKVGFWYRQLLAESIGKKKTKQGKLFKYSLLPTVSTSVDLHSLAQLQLGGYEGVYTHFIAVSELKDGSTTTDGWILETVPLLTSKSIEAIKDAISIGVQEAYDDANLPYRHIQLKNISAYEIGYLLASSMCEVMYLCHSMGVDAFNQPSVEDYKKHTRKALTETE